MTEFFDRLDTITTELVGYRKQAENARATELLKQRDPIASMLSTGENQTIKNIERRITDLEAERDSLFEEIFSSLLSQKATLEKELKAARQKATQLEWFERLQPVDKYRRLSLMQSEVRSLQRELATFPE